MATAVAPGNPAKLAMGLPGRGFDHIFFSGMALLLLATSFVGFAPTYYLAGVFHAPLPSLIVHLHGAAFSCWIPKMRSRRRRVQRLKSLAPGERAPSQIKLEPCARLVDLLCRAA